MSNLSNIVLNPVDELIKYIETTTLKDDEILAQKLLAAFKRLILVFLHLGIALGLLIMALMFVIFAVIL
jgi:hypothetical protein